ncbi:hypothetical protein [Rhizobium sullae]|uniref:hypothetical protein n=1 Tax=Rhizobium sullae TaxID=50338 RepID=UPI0018E20597|nr:hypothetical protein [Rhizobium sullae]
MYFINPWRMFASSSDPPQRGGATAKFKDRDEKPVKMTNAGFTLLRGTSGLVFAGAILSLVACVAPTTRPVMTENQQDSAYIGDLTLARFWGDDATPEVKALIANQYLQIRNAARIGVRSESVRHADYLAISGGGANGAFGAGFLVGWGKRGDRPESRLSPASVQAHWLRHLHSWDQNTIVNWSRFILNTEIKTSCVVEVY